MRIYLCILKDCNLFNFGDRLRLALIASLRYFYFVNADTAFNGYNAAASLILYLSKTPDFGNSGHPVYDPSFLLACYISCET